MNTLSLRDLVRNAAAVFSGVYGSVTDRARQSRCSRQAVYDQARRIEQRLQPQAPQIPPLEVPLPSPTPSLDEPTRRRFAVNAFAMGLSTRQIEDLLGLLIEDGPDHSTIARWVKDAAQKAKPVLQALDAACIPEVHTLAVDEIFFGGDRPWSASNQPA